MVSFCGLGVSCNRACAKCRGLFMLVLSPHNCSVPDLGMGMGFGFY